MSIARHHAEWLSLVEVSGPFLSLPVLLRAFPQGLPARDPELSKETKLMFADWLDGQNDRAVHIGWCGFVLRSVLKFPPEVVAEGQTIPPGMEAHMSEFGEVLRPSLAILPPKGVASPKPRLLIQIVAPGQDLEKPLKEKHWKASPATRMTELLHAADVSLGLVTNGEHWMLVHAPRGETSGFASWFAPLWFEEPLTFQAFQALLSVERFFGVPDDQTIEALLNESAKDQQEVTEQLGWQVRKAVEVLIQSLDKIDQDHGRKLLGGIDEKQLYEAALTIMMRLVFLMCAEERKILFPSDCQDYQDFYAISTLHDQLQEVADKHVEEVLDARFDAWSRLLATFRAVYGGVQHEAMRLPPYGGTLFDPDRFPFLEGRKPGTHWRTTPAEPLKVSNRTVLHLLNALQILQVKVPGGGAAEAHRISFRALDIEQIGHVYEGLLDHTAKRATEPVLGLRGGKDSESEIALSKLEALKAKGLDELAEFLKEVTGRSDKALKKAITDEELTDDQHLLIACGHDRGLFDRVHPYAALLREDTLGYPVVINTGSIYVTQGTDRRSTGTHYTPRSLTEPIVQHTLEPLVYNGVSEGKPPAPERLKSPREILALKVCDMTMGSGAFLVQTCRYLAERLVEAWEIAERANPGKFLATPEGDFSAGDPRERLIPADPAERLAIARRYVADRCLYGVDINLMAVEMAKLSLWLITLQRDRPFTFLDHALKCGDSLLGVSSVKQIENFTLRVKEGEYVEHTFATINLFRYVDEASNKRRELESLPSNDHTQIETKNRLHIEAETATAKVKTLADTLIAFELLGLDGDAYEKQRTIAADHAEVAMRKPLLGFQAYAREQLHGRRPFHWPVEFPEVFSRSGFDAFVGNPPFMGGKKITGNFGCDYRNFLVEALASHTRGNADLCAYFFLRVRGLLRNGGHLGLLATNSVAQGDTREVSLDQLTGNGCVIIRAIRSRRWPGAANLEVAQIWMRLGMWSGNFILDDQPVEGITPYLAEVSLLKEAKPKSLAANDGFAFIGVVVYGEGFVLSMKQAEVLIAEDERNRAVVLPYLNGEDLNTSPVLQPQRFVIDFGDFTLEEAKKFHRCFEQIEQSVKPFRQTVGEQRMREKWWLHQRPRPSMRKAIASIKRVLVTARISPSCAVAFIPNKYILNDKLVVFPFDEDDAFSILQSEVHWAWVRQFTTTLGGTTLSYSPSDCLQTFPFPKGTSITGDGPSHPLMGVGARVEAYRGDLMRKQMEGLTDTYNRFHDRDEKSEDIARLRALHVEMDQAVAAAYGWSDLDLGHGFHETKQRVRYTISEPARRTVLDRLLALNHQRYAEEVKAGLHDKKKSKTPRARKSAPVLASEPELFAVVPKQDIAPLFTMPLIVHLLSASPRLRMSELKRAFDFITNPELMQNAAAPVDNAAVKMWADKWRSPAGPEWFIPTLRRLAGGTVRAATDEDDPPMVLVVPPRPTDSPELKEGIRIALRLLHSTSAAAMQPQEKADFIRARRAIFTTV